MAASKFWNNRIAALALGLGLAISAVIGPCWWSIIRYHNPVCSAYKPDFISLYTGARLMWTDSSSLYDLEKQRLVQEPIDPSRSSWVLPFYYPPFFAVVLLPLAWLSFSTAFLAMTLINLALLGVSIKILIRTLQLNRQQTNWLLLTTFCNYGVHYGLLEAQSSFIALWLLVFSVTAVACPVRHKAGISSGLMVFKPPLAAGPFLVLLGRKQWRDIGLALTIIVALGFISLAAVGVEGVQAYLELSRRAAAGEDFLHIQPEGMHNLRALSYYFFAPPWRDFAWGTATLAVMVLIYIHSRADDPSGEISIARWISILAGSILVAPHLHSHDLSLLIVPAALVLKRFGDAVPSWVALSLVAIGILPLINTIAYQHLPPLLPIALLIFLAVDGRCKLSH
jgi:hypothetical protein